MAKFSNTYHQHWTPPFLYAHCLTFSSPSLTHKSCTASQPASQPASQLQMHWQQQAKGSNDIFLLSHAPHDWHANMHAAHHVLAGVLYSSAVNATAACCCCSLDIVVFVLVAHHHQPTWLPVDCCFLFVASCFSWLLVVAIAAALAANAAASHGSFFAPVAITPLLLTGCVHMSQCSCQATTCFLLLAVVFLITIVIGALAWVWMFFVIFSLLLFCGCQHCLFLPSCLCCCHCLPLLSTAFANKKIVWDCLPCIDLITIWYEYIIYMLVRTTYVMCN